jgi:hypothetical protein
MRYSRVLLAWKRFMIKIKILKLNLDFSRKMRDLMRLIIILRYIKKHERAFRMLEKIIKKFEGEDNFQILWKLSEIFNLFFLILLKFLLY